MQAVSPSLYQHAELTHEIIAAGIEVHRYLGAGLLESAYCACLEHEFELRGVRVAREQPVGLQYKGLVLERAFRADFVVDEKVVVEVKAVDRLEPVHDAQLLTYLKLRCLSVGLVLNFNVPSLRQSIRRLVR